MCQKPRNLVGVEISMILLARESMELLEDLTFVVNPNPFKKFIFDHFGRQIKGG